MIFGKWLRKSTELTDLKLKRGREKSVLRRHPWIYSGAVEETIGAVQPGSIVRVVDFTGKFLAWASFSPQSQIRARVWSWNESDEINEGFLLNKCRQAIELRKRLKDLEGGDSCRLIHGESDGLPGLIVDKFADNLVIQISFIGMETFRSELINIFKEDLGFENIYERSDIEIRDLEGLPHRNEHICGQEPDDNLIILENGIKYFIDVKHGQKTGFFLDQRVNRHKIRNYSQNKQVLNCFSYTGGFSLNPLFANADHVTSIDTSRDALDLAKRNLSLNSLDPQKAEWIEGDVFLELRKFRDNRSVFDLIILDPPKFAPTSSFKDRAARAYKDINLLAFKLIKPGGVLFTFSCSGGISTELFQKIVADAALDAGVHARIIEHLSQAPDHPISLNFPEGSYLKGLVCII